MFVPSKNKPIKNKTIEPNKLGRDPVAFYYGIDCCAVLSRYYIAFIVVFLD